MVNSNFSTISTASLKNIVVPISEIVNLLRLKLSQSEIEALLSAVLAKIPKQVYPGEIITAELMNGILANVVDLQLRVAKLEGTIIPEPGAVKIVEILPKKAKYTVGEEIVISGENFEFSIGATRVHFDKKSVFAFKNGSRDDRLVVDIPDPGNLSKDGSDVWLTVSNRNSSAYVIIKVLPSEVPLYGSVLITPATVDPNPTEASKEALFGYTLTSAASKAAVFAFEVFLAKAGEALDNQKYDSLVSILDQDKKQLTDRRMMLPLGTVKGMFVKISKMPFENKTAFDILVKASANGAKGESQIKRYTVGEKVEDDDYLVLESPTYVPKDAVQGGTAQLAKEQELRVDTILKLSPKAIKDGMTKAVCDISLDLTEGSGWTQGLLTPIPSAGTPSNGTLTLTVQADGKTPVPYSLSYGVAAIPGPSPLGRLELVVKRHGEDKKSKNSALILSLVSA